MSDTDQAAPAVPETPAVTEPVAPVAEAVAPVEAAPVEVPAEDIAADQPQDAVASLTLAHVHDELLTHYRAIEHNTEAHVLAPIWSLIERIKAEISL